MEIEAFKQGDAVSSCGYTVKGLCGWQIRHLYSSQQHHPSEGKPAPKSGMYAHTCYVLGRESKVMVSGFSSCCFTEIDVPIDLRWVSQGISGLL